MKRITYSKVLADKWMKLGYKIVALSYTGCFGETPLAFHLEKELSCSGSRQPCSNAVRI